MRISLIACINKVNALGKNNDLLYHIKEDLVNFKRLTLGNIIIMGKTTYESLPKKPLPNRTTIIISSDENYNPQVSDDADTVYVCDTIESALSTAETICEGKEVFVVGGASIYHQFINQRLVDTMFLTVVDDDAEGDVSFPSINQEDFRTVFKLTAHVEEGKPSYEFLILKKNKND